MEWMTCKFSLLQVSPPRHVRSKPAVTKSSTCSLTSKRSSRSNGPSRIKSGAAGWSTTATAACLLTPRPNLERTDMAARRNPCLRWEGGKTGETANRREYSPPIRTTLPEEIAPWTRIGYPPRRAIVTPVFPPTVEAEVTARRGAVMTGRWFTGEMFTSSDRKTSCRDRNGNSKLLRVLANKFCKTQGFLKVKITN